VLVIRSVRDIIYVMEWTPEEKEKRSKAVQKMWKDPAFRKRMIEKQKKIGYRNYGDGIFYSTNTTRRNNKEKALASVSLDD